MKNIVLIGFMGVGKGSVAREIVKRTSMMALDTDDIIESIENRSVKEIFASDGEEYFRSLERKTARWLKKNVEGTVVSTGGGFFKVPAVRKIGTVVLLNAPFEVIYERILAHPDSEKKLQKRPLFQDIDKARALYNQRLEQYLKVANMVVDVTGKDIGMIAKEIIKKGKKTMKILVAMVMTIIMAYAGGIKWEKDYANGLKISKASKRPMFFVISSHNCRFCVMYDKATLSNPKVIEKLNRDFINVIAYVDDNAVFPNDLYVGGTPATWFIAPDGEPMFQPLMGALEPEQLTKALDIVKAERAKAPSPKTK